VSLLLFLLLLTWVIISWFRFVLMVRRCEFRNEYTPVSGKSVGEKDGRSFMLPLVGELFRSYLSSALRL
jgi:hypothetical protein